MAGENLGASFSIDVTNLQAGLAQANRLIRESESQFREAAAGMDDWSNSSEGLSARVKSLSDQVDIQKQKVSALADEKQRIIDTMMEEGKSNEDIARAVDVVNKQIERESKQLDKLNGDLDKSTQALDKFKSENEKAATPAEKLRNTISEQEKKLSDLKEAHLNAVLAYGKNSKQAKALDKQIDELSDSLNDNKSKLDDAGDSAEKAGDSMEKAGGSSGIFAGALKAVGAAAVAAVGAFFGLAESTRESRENMAKLETGFTTAGHSAEAATKTYEELYGILGDDGQATEAAAHLAQLTNNQEELAQWTNIATGVYATFGDSLPIENLTEAANETAKTGKITGGLADALNWAGVSEDDFQASLDACTSEQERQALITNTLNGLYSEAADKYKEVNADVIAAQKAQAGFNSALNDLGAIAEPIMTMLKTLATELLVSITPFVKLIGEGLGGAMEGTAGAADSLAEGIGGVIDTLLGTVNSMLPMVLEVIAKLVPAIITSLLNQIPALLETVVNAITMIINALSEALPGILIAIAQLIPQIINTLVAAVPQVLQAAITLLLAIVQALPTIIDALVTALPTVIQTIVDTVINGLPLLIEASITLLMAIVDAIPTIIDALVTALPDIINTIVTGVIDGLPYVLDGAIQLLMAIIDAIPVLITALVKNLPQITMAIVNTLISRLPDIIQGAIQLFMAILEAIPVIVVELVKNMPQIISSIVEGLEAGFSAIFDAGVNLVKGIWEGISSAASWLWDKVSGWASGLVDDIKGFFGINSPSKVMADMVGKNLALGIGEGFTDEFGRVSDDITRAAGKLNPTIGATVKAGAGGLASGLNGVTVYQTNNYSQAHSRYELYKSKQETAAAVRLALGGA